MPEQANHVKQQKVWIGRRQLATQYYPYLFLFQEENCFFLLKKNAHLVTWFCTKLKHHEPNINP